MSAPIMSALESKTAAMLIPCSAKIGELAIAWPRRPAPTSAMLCCPCVRRILRISDEQRVDRVADAALAELAEVREVAPDLRRVDVRVVGDLLRGDALLAHLLRLRQHLQVAREAGGDADGEAVRGAGARRNFATSRSHCAQGSHDGRSVVTNPYVRDNLRRSACLVHVVDERPLAVDLDDRQPLTVALLELRHRR